MNNTFAEKLKQLRTKAGLSQQQLADKLHVDRSTIAKWENGSRQPDAAMISRLSERLNTDVFYLLHSFDHSDHPVRIVVVDDEKIVLNGSISALKKALPDTEVIGFSEPDEALACLGKNRVDLVLLDIEMGRFNGLDICREILDRSPNTNVIYLTAYREFAYDAWATGAVGFILKPLTDKRIGEMLRHLHYPQQDREAVE